MNNENIFLLAINIFVVLLSCGIFMIFPRLTRKALLFGVKIPAEEANCPEALEMKKYYSRVIAFGGLIMLALCILQFILAPDYTLFTTMYIVLLIFPLQLIAFIPNWKKALRLKEERGWQVTSSVFADTSSSHTRGNLSALPWFWYVASAIVVIATVILSVVRYPHLPDMIPAHFDAAMQVTRYVPTTFWNVFMMPIVNAGMFLVLFLTGVAIEKAKLQMEPAQPRISFFQHRIYRKRLGNAIGFLTLVMVIMMAAIGMAVIYPMPQQFEQFGIIVFWITMALMLIPVAVLVIVQIKTGQGGGKVKVSLDEITYDETQKTASGTPKTVAQDDKYWLLGMFYFNREDPALIVEDRFGTNIGFNFARLPAQIGAVLLGAGFIVMYVWLTIILVQT